MRLLIVEDDLDGREMLAELFRLHDWEVTAVPSTSSGLDLLRSGGFDVVISDEDLCGQSGSCMLREADREGLLSNVGVLMYTAEPSDLELPDGVRVLRKPLGIRRLLDEATAIVPDGTEPHCEESADSRSEADLCASAAAAEGPSSGRVRKKVQLVLYVNESEGSRHALENLQTVLASTPPRRVDVQVRNVERHPDERDAVANRASFTPVLAERQPGEPERILGAVESTRSLAQLIMDLDAGAPSSSQHTLAEGAPPSSVMK